MSIGYKLLNIDTPLVFADGQNAYDNLAKTYSKHAKGYFVLAPSGSGKTHFISRQTKFDWLDGDDLWQVTNALPDGAWWDEPLERRVELEARSDVITQEAKRLGFWIIGGSNTWLRPDAIVIPSWTRHKKYLAARDKNNYDGGFSSSQFDRVKVQRKWFSRWSRQGVPKFATVDEAAEYLASQR